jgi:NAD(P)-dependent dehydrogenase (short-subunit alcohol dehydrogenase family)
VSRRDALTGLGLALGATAASAQAAVPAGVDAAAGATAPADATPAPGARRKTADAKDCVALVTGSNTGIGLGFVQVLLARGARRIYATARRPETLADVVALDPQRVVALELDVTNDPQRRAAAAKARDVTWLINNAGISGSDDPKERRFLTATSFDDARRVMETNFWAQAEMVRLFAPLLVANSRAAIGGGNGAATGRSGAIVQILSVGALYAVPAFGSYSASKFAARAMIAAVRADLDREPVLAAGVFTGGVNTRMTPASYTRGISPQQHANDVLDALARGETDVFAGAGAREAYERQRADPEAFERANIERFNAQPLP